jgi:flagellar protein FlaF
METALISIVAIALVIVSTVTMTMGLFQSATGLADSWHQIEQQAASVRQTEINLVPPDNYSGGPINLVVLNTGQANLGDFPSWDVIVQYQGNDYITYSESYPPADNRWTINGIYITGNGSERFDPGILNPGEEINMVINLQPEIGTEEAARISVTTPNGVTATCYVIRPIPESPP